MLLIVVSRWLGTAGGSSQRSKVLGLIFFVKTFAAGKTVARERRGRTMDSESPALTPAGELLTAAGSNGDISFDSELEIASRLKFLGGRRIIELILLPLRLRRGCYSCKTFLHLWEIVKETRQGLSSILHVKCSSCDAMNMVQTSKSHTGAKGKRRAFDVNTKLALGKCCLMNLLLLFLY